MKCTFCTLVSFLLFSFSIYAGVDSSGGDGVGNFSIQTGFKPGAFSVQMVSAKDSSLNGVLKYFNLAGARSTPVNGGTAFVLGDAAISQSNNPMNRLYYRMQFTLAYSDLYSVATTTQVTILEFRGPLAVALYEGMSKGGAPVYSKNLDTNRNVVGMTYVEAKSLMCSKRMEGGLRGGTSCVIWLVPLPKN